MTTKHPPHVDLLIDARNIGSALIEIAGKIHMLSALRPDRIEMAIRSLVLRDLEVHADKLMVALADYKRETFKAPVVSAEEYERLVDSETAAFKQRTRS